MRTRPLLHSELEGNKVCTRCTLLKPVTEFPSRGASKGHSLNSRCRSCRTEIAREAKYYKKYGITWEQYQKMLSDQDNKCLACSREADRGRGPWSSRPSLVLDHNHKTGRARGLVCNRCNWALGVLENSKLMKQLKRYLRKFEES